MYPPKQNPPASQENARDIADAIDQLIRLRINGALAVHSQTFKVAELKELDEKCEVIIRRITDYLLATDPRHGVYKS